MKDDSGSYAVKDHQHLKWQPQKSWTLFQDYQDAQDKQQTQYSLTSRSKWKCTDVIENSKVRMSRYSDTSTRTQMANIIVQYGRPSCSSWAESVRSSFGRTVMGTAMWESSIKTRLGKRFQIVNVCSLTEKKDDSYLCMWTISNWLGKSGTLVPHGKFPWKTLIWENQHHSSNMFIWVALKENVR